MRFASMLIFSIFLMHLKLFLFLHNVQLEFSQERGSREKDQAVNHSDLAYNLQMPPQGPLARLRWTSSFSIPQAPEDGMVRP